MVCETCGERIERLKRLLEEKINTMSRTDGSYAITAYQTAREALVHAGMTPDEVEAFVDEVARRRRAGRS